MGTEKKLQQGDSVYFVGIKGTGVCALAELMHNAGVKVSGSDTTEVFYTDAILKELNIPYYENFDAAHVGANIDMVIHSAAYSADSNPELAQTQKLNIPVMKYTDALGAWSAKFDSTGVCGVHGKTTTTAICGVLMRAAALPAQILTGSAALDFDGRSTLSLGDKYFIAETCEYRSHFLSFHPKRIILTAVESDHQDFFPDYESIRDAFVEYCRLLPQGGQLIYCADDSGASEVARIIEKENHGVALVPYGFTASGGWRVVSYNVENERAVFTISGIPGEFKMRIPGRHQALNVVAALALTVSLMKEENSFSDEKIQSIKTALENFRSTKRRSEIIGEAGGIIFMDDYGHHPTAIKSTLDGIKSFYPNRRLIVSFMSHTYTRTSALLEEFASCFNGADIVFFHKIYASARENYSGGVNGMTLYEKTAVVRSGESKTFYVDEPDNAFVPLCEMLKPGDIFLTLGAGNNWPLGEKLFSHFKSIDNKKGVHHG
ncbi:MAG: UDP-N-acetylmuramate--L-alanine ligase [Treponema sp.]|jgi:UDP-N-acetylmuramate--alanine ligase|nr:UDP-N-acetylmuramate--L-alanine ligase [Treponema sp.]